MTNVLTKRTNPIAINVTITDSIKCRRKKVRDYHLLHTALLGIISLLIITIICYHYAKQKGVI